MDFLNKSYIQVAELFRSMTPAARVTTGLLLAVLVVSMIFLFRNQSDKADEYLLGGEVLSQSEISAIEAAFSKAKLGKWEIEGNRIRVPRSQKHAYIEAIAADNAFPDTPNSVWHGMFTDANPLIPKSVRELEASRSLERSLEVTIQKMSGIEVAVVHITEIDKGGFPRRPESRASVSVKAKGNDEIDSRRVETIRNMVAYGGGVDQSNVTVTDLNSGETHPGTGKDGPLVDNLYAKHQRKFEDELKAKIVDRLRDYPNVRVAVHVDLATNLLEEEISDQYDDKPTALQTSDYTKEETSTRPDVAGRPGVVSNAAVGNTAAQVNQVAAAESTTTERRENQKSVAGMTRRRTQTAPFVPNWMSVSIGIPRSYFTTVWRQRNPTPPGEDPAPPDPTQLQKIEDDVNKELEDAVTTLLPKVALGEDPYPRVKVVPYTDTVLPAPEGPSTAETAMTWLASNWQTVGLFLLTVFGVFVLRGMIRSAQASAISAPSSPSPAMPTPAQLDEELEDEDEDEDDVINSLRAKFQPSGRSLRDELSELVREDPDAAASVLQNWIGDAA